MEMGGGDSSAIVRVLLVLHLVLVCGFGQDLREDIIKGTHACIKYDAPSRTFTLECNFNWFSNHTGSEFISLEANETFEGNDLNISSAWLGEEPESVGGMFTSNVNTLRTFAEAPKIRNLHIIGGKTEHGGGFIIRKGQRYFRIDSCTSSGRIEGAGSGGIAGSQSGRYGGRVEISNCSSFGTIGVWNDAATERGGGIVGERAAHLGGFVSIDNSFSSGEIDGFGSGGIVGSFAGSRGGIVHITRSHCTGLLNGGHAGGIIGTKAGHSSGFVFVQQSYSVGNIGMNSWSAGGIAGSEAGSLDGYVSIRDCYARGEISSSSGAGLCGENAGGSGFLDIVNCFAFKVFSYVSTSSMNITVTNCVYDNVFAIQAASKWSSHVVQTQNSDSFEEIRGKLLHNNEAGISLWSQEVWKANASLDGLPKLRFEVEPELLPNLELPWDLRSSIIRGKIPCIDYSSALKEFRIECNIAWGTYWTPAHFISLKAGEVFDGMDYQVDLSSLPLFYGLFRIDRIGAASTEAPDVPHIRRVHTTGSRTANAGGFIVRREQKTFHVTSCSSSGTIGGVSSGGICGSSAILDQLPLTISNSYSLGNIDGQFSGGIIGGNTNGIVEIKRCHSAGVIGGQEAGGIVGNSAGGAVRVEQSYSTGSILGDAAGGICGASAANDEGKVVVVNSYTSGGIMGESAGGILGGDTGINSGQIYLENVYAGGRLTGSPAGGLIGHLSKTAGKTRVFMSVHSAPLVGRTEIGFEASQNTPSLDVINGSLYHGPKKSWPSDVWVVPAPNQFPILRFQLHTPSPIASGSPVPSPVPSASSTPLPSTGLDFDVQPRIIDVHKAHTLLSSNDISQPVQLTAQMEALIEWRTVSAFANLLVSLPKREWFSPEDGKRYIEQNIVLHSHRFPVGNTVLDVFAVFRRSKKYQETIRVSLNVTITQADPAMESSAVEIVASMHDGIATRPVKLSNFGSHRVVWKTLLYFKDVSAANPWLTVPANGVVAGNNNTDIQLRFVPQNTDGAGAYSAWMLVYTDAWENNHPQEKDDMPPASIIARGKEDTAPAAVYFWVHIQLTVSSIFLCPQQARLLLRPFDAKETKVTIVNTDIEDVTVAFFNFMLEYVGAAQFENAGGSKRSTMSLARSVLWNNTIQLTPWIRLFPSTMHLERGLNKDAKLQVGYSEAVLPGFAHGGILLESNS